MQIENRSKRFISTADPDRIIERIMRGKACGFA